MQPAAAESAPEEGAGAGIPGGLLPWASLLTIYFVWGSTFIGIRVAVRTIPPLLMGGVRFLVAGGILYALASRRSSAGGARPTREEWRAAAVAAALMLLVANGCVSWAETRVDAGNASLLVATVPFWLVLVDGLWGRRRIGFAVWAGLVVGFGGVALLVHPTASHRIDPAGAAALLCTACAWAFGSLYAVRAATPSTPLLGPAMQMLTGGGMLLVAGTVFGELSDVHLDAISTSSLLALAWLIGPGAIVGLSAYTYALTKLPTATVATYAYVNPVVAVGLAAVLLHEHVTAQMLEGGGLVLVSVAVIVAARRVAARRAPIG
jgi:drug/metabolite transporter (DMT)-like permease